MTKKNKLLIKKRLNRRIRIHKRIINVLKANKEMDYIQDYKDDIKLCKDYIKEKLN